MPEADFQRLIGFLQRNSKRFQYSYCFEKEGLHYLVNREGFVQGFTFAEWRKILDSLDTYQSI